MFSIADVKGMKVTVMGLGLNGGGLASAVFFARHGAEVTVTDMKDERFLRASLDALNDFPDIRFVLGRHEIADFANADLVIKNPGVKRDGNRFLDAAKKIETDISIFLQLTEAPIIAVTGSKGKSSTVSALQFGFSALGYRSFLGGNITVSPLTFWDKVSEKTPVVLELSSFQLNDLRGCGFFKPCISIITPIVADHQNWYGSMEAYLADKKVIYRNQDLHDFTICNADQHWGAEFARETKAAVGFYSAHKTALTDCSAHFGKAPRVYFTEKGEGVVYNGVEETLLVPRDTQVLSFPLKQNVLNAAFALYRYGVKPELIPAVMKRYPGLEHRLEFFYETETLRFYDDTTATVPEAAVAALNAFSADGFAPPILIAGGTDKNLQFAQFAREAKKAGAIFLLEGTATELLIPELKKNEVPFFGTFNSLEKLLLEVKDYTTGLVVSAPQKKIPVVLSPGAASFGLFKNEFDRGNQFKALVKKLFL